MNDRLVLFVQIECFVFGLIECIARYANQCYLWRKEETEKNKKGKIKMCSTTMYLQWRSHEKVFETFTRYFLRWIFVNGNLIAFVERESFVGGTIN